MSDGQEKAMEHQEMMQLHEANSRAAQRGPTPADQARLIDKVVDSELEAEDQGLENLKAKDFPLSNFDEEVDTVEFKWMQEILAMFSKARYPHPDSGLQGLARAWATGDPGNRLRSLRVDEYAQDEAYLLGTYSRAKRGENMAQQDSTSKMVTESHAVRENSSSDSGGGLLGRFRS